MTCRGCRFYVPEVKDGVTSPFGFCNSPHVSSGYDRQLEKLYADHSGIHVENDEGWGMYVGEDFGCIHFADRGLEGNVA